MALVALLVSGIARHVAVLAVALCHGVARCAAALHWFLPQLYCLCCGVACCLCASHGQSLHWQGWRPFVLHRAAAPVAAAVVHSAFRSKKKRTLPLPQGVGVLLSVTSMAAATFCHCKVQ